MVSLLMLLIITVACSTAQLSSKNPKIVAKNICMNSEGRGRLSINGKKYVFTYFSALSNEDSKWTLGLSFPFQDEELFELDWSENKKMKFKTSIDDKILRENSNIDPNELDQFIKSLGLSLQDIIKLKSKDNSRLTYSWKVQKNSLEGENKTKQTQVNFTNINTNGYFGLIEFDYQKQAEQNFKIEFILNECFEKKSISVKLH